MAGHPCRLAGKVRRPLLRAPSSIPPNDEGSGPSAAKATSGLEALITRSTCVEDAGHRVVQRGAPRLDATRAPRSRTAPRCARPRSASRASGRRRTRASGRPSSLRRLTVPLIDHAAPMRGSDVSTPSIRANPASAIRCPAASSSCSHMAGDTTAPPQSATTATRRPRRSSAWVPRPASQPLDAGEAERIGGVVPVGDVEQAGRVPDGAGQAAGRGRVVPDLELRPPGDAAVGRLQADQAGEAGGDPDRAAAVTTRGQRHQTAGDGGRAPARGTARRPREVPGVAGRAVEDRAGQVDAAELAGRRLTGRHRASPRRRAGARGWR